MECKPERTEVGTKRRDHASLCFSFLNLPNHAGNIAMTSSPFEEFEEQE
jgi:hypothetical protein